MLPDVSGILSRLYTDRMTVYRYGGAKGPDGEESSVLGTLPVLEDIPCRLSLGGKDSPVMTEDGNPADIQPTLICRPETPLKSGDFITVRRLVNKAWADVYKGHIGRPNLYGSSLQVLFRDLEKS